MFKEKPRVTKRLQKDQGLRDRRTLWGKGVRLRDKGPREMSANKGTPVRYHIFWTIRLTSPPPRFGRKMGVRLIVQMQLTFTLVKYYVIYVIKYFTTLLLQFFFPILL